MSQEIWNLGRVVGYSAYEMYVKNFLENYPDMQPASERQWLASMLGMGSSMLLKIKPDSVSGPHSVDIYLPGYSMLTACETVIASLFVGHGIYDGDSLWSTRVSDYGPLISNDSNAAPVQDYIYTPERIPKKADDNFDDTRRHQIREYMKLIDGVIIQPGYWKPAEVAPPKMDFSPDFHNNVPIVRLLLSDSINTEFEILITGFAHKSVVAGITNEEGSTRATPPRQGDVPVTPDNESGDFLGPATFPWANKIVFSLPTATTNYFMMQKYKRQLSQSAGVIQVDDIPVVDMRTTDPGTYYKSYHSEAREPIKIADFSTTGTQNAVITVWNRKTKYPPALWGTVVGSRGNNYLHPLDIVAPGSIKLFPNASEDDMKEYQDTYPGTWGWSLQPDGTIWHFTPDGELTEIAKIIIQDIDYTSAAASSGKGRKAKRLHIETGTHTTLALSLGAAENSQYTITPDPASNKTIGGTSFNVGGKIKESQNSSNITWDMLLDALANDWALDVLGDNMKLLKAGLNANPPYVAFSNGLRLYISTREPTGNIPVGSIGIGW